MGNILTRTDHNGSSSTNEGDRFLREMKKLLALDGSPEGTTGVPPSQSCYHKHASSRKPVDNDVLSKATDSTKGSPDFSLQGRMRLGEPQRHTPASSSSSSTSCTSLPRRGPHHHVFHSTAGTIETGPAGVVTQSNHGSSTSSHMSKSPFSRFFRSRKSEDEKSPHSYFHQHPHNHNKKTSNLPSCVTVVEQHNPQGQRPPSYHGSDVVNPAMTAAVSTTTTATTTTRIPVKSNPGSQGSFEDDEESTNHLQQLYDLRTWDMYLRITEARKKQQQTVQHQIPHAQPSTGDDSGHDYSCSSYDEYGWFDDATSATNGEAHSNDFVPQQQHQVLAPTPLYPQQLAAQYVQPLYASSPLMPMPQSPPIVAAATPTDISQELIFGELDL